jgi:thioredoxin reductase (NADPH)
MHDVIIIGGGAAGLGAALYSTRFKLDTLVLAKQLGGTGNVAHKVENWLGVKEITGPELMKNFAEHVKSYNVPIEDANVSKIEKDGNSFKVSTDKETYEAKAIIIATGMRHRELGAPGEKEFLGKGVSYCYTCDAAMFRGKTVGMVGGSDAAGMGALLLTEYAEKVYVIYRKDKIRAEPITTEKVYAHPKIEVIHNANVKEIKGDKFMSSVVLDTGQELELQGLFIEIGAVPVTVLAEPLGVEISERGFIKVDRQQATNVQGVFAAGDITDSSPLKQFITSAAEGSVAAQGVHKFLSQSK